MHADYPSRITGDVSSPDQPLNEARSEIYKRLMEAQERIARALYRQGVSNEAVRDALDASDESLSDAERREDLFLSALAHYVGALGGRLEVRAIFGNEEILVRHDPG